ncbi:Metallo-hydrolase/oxidoreductase [Leucogyrophana mollusca]|uniref:Metallo-hydrolase/oxidoreductase n=1 Tax=Leucogyrophana mollusca TaxID=85980 RepID=A0ACB8BWL9_9AGAM|nr:Metallo-hydrolase/oxidoreductase [Leucogyrophana mollusca]
MLLLRHIAFRTLRIRAFSTSALSKMKIVPVPVVYDDNYAYLIIDETSRKAAAVDPLELHKVEAAAQKENVEIVACLTTHWHQDHSGGNADFRKKYPNAPIYGGRGKNAKGEHAELTHLTHHVADKDEVRFGDSIVVKCLATPCHTEDSTCYNVTDESKPSQAAVVFTGDTLFQGGCGRFNSGTGAEMNAALKKLGALDDSTLVYNGHEYTAGNLAFAKSIDPDSPGIQELAQFVEDNKGFTTGKSTIGHEKRWNVFMRLNSDAVKSKTGYADSDPEDLVISKLRELKNNFRR